MTSAKWYRACLGYCEAAAVCCVMVSLSQGSCAGRWGMLNVLSGGYSEYLHTYTS